MTERLDTLSAAVGLRAVAWKPSLPAGRFTPEATTDTRTSRSWPIDGTTGAKSEVVQRCSMR